MNFKLLFRLKLGLSLFAISIQYSMNIFSLQFLEFINFFFQNLFDLFSN